MPLIASTYKPSFLFKNAYFSTIYCGIVRKINGVLQERERITLPDSDFLDLDWSFSNKASIKVVLLLHGLEGNAQRAYILGAAKELNRNGFDVCAINFRGCSGETNNLYRGYHSGATEDLDAVVQHILNTKTYHQMYLQGFSLGGNLVLKYLGEKRVISPIIKAAIAISVPCDLLSCSVELLKLKNSMYASRFKKRLVTKLKVKQHLFPIQITDQDINSINNLKDFDDVYTSRAHGFKDALDYYARCSANQFLSNITIPTLMINAKNDSFLGNECYPITDAKKNQNLYLEIPKYGGHVGFYGKNNISYIEKRATKFFEEQF